MKICQRTHQGLKRPTNQDSLLCEDRVYGVADGMGGHKGGETASRLAVETVGTLLRGKTPGHELLNRAVDAANMRIRETARDDENLNGMGTTLTLLWEGETELLIGQVGDSRAYLLRDGELRQITEDHSVVAELVRKHLITEEMARNSAYRSMITRAVGVDAKVDTDIFTEEKRPGDVWLLCSDGLSNMVSDPEMREILLSGESDEAAADRLLSLALENGGTDNITFLLARVDGENKA